MSGARTASSLPAAARERVGHAAGETGRDLIVDPLDALRESLVMIVDDTATTIEVLQSCLEDSGYRNFVTTAEPSEAIDLAVRETPDVVLLDISMPGQTGFDVLREMGLRPELEHTPTIVLMSSNDSETKRQALHLGAADFLAKPVDSSELVLRLRNTLAARAYLDRLIYFDPLTGLPNRQSFVEHLDGILGRAQREDQASAVLLIDLDRFKEINDSLGHAAGDQLLQKVARRLEKCVRQVDSVGLPARHDSRGPLSRVGGDEFTVVLSDLAGIEDANRVAERIGLALSRPVELAGHQVVVTPSIGIASFPNDGSDRETLLRRADIAMSHAKRKGRNTFQNYSDNISAKTKAELSLQAQLHDALERDELILHYQPKVDIRTGVVTGSEALVRWQHPERGLVPPAEFIWLAEEAGLGGRIGEWALATACTQNTAWRAAGLGTLRVAVNVSSSQFRDGGLVRSIERALESTRSNPEYLIVELTERTMIEEAQDNIEILHRLKSMGVKLSVDDFGTGYSSLTYLEQFPLDELKIDRAFVMKIDAERADAPLVSAIVAMAHSLRFRVVAEGVDSEEQLEFLRARGCDEYQGFVFSKPVCAEEFSKLLSAWRPPSESVGAQEHGRQAHTRATHFRERIS